MRQLLGIVFLFGALSFVACQQTQEDDEPEGTTVIEKETTVMPAEEPDAKVEMDIKMEGEGGASGEVKVEGE